METLSRRLAQRLIANDDGDPKLLEWYRYKIELRLGRAVTYGTMFLIALFTNKLLESLLFLVFLTVLRKVAGGYHAKGHLACYISSIVCFGAGVFLLPLLQAHIPFISIAFLAASVACTIAFAPIIHPNLPQKKGDRAKLRWLSLLVVTLLAITILLAAWLGAPEPFIWVSCNGMLFASVLLVWAKLWKQEGEVNIHEG